MEIVVHLTLLQGTVQCMWYAMLIAQGSLDTAELLSYLEMFMKVQCSAAESCQQSHLARKTSGRHTSKQECKYAAGKQEHMQHV